VRYKEEDSFEGREKDKNLILHAMGGRLHLKDGFYLLSPTHTAV
jgi:hypothetical protein